MWSVAELDAVQVHLPTPDGTTGSLSLGLLRAAGIVPDYSEEDHDVVPGC